MLVGALVMGAASQSADAQCSWDPDDYTYRTVIGDFDRDGHVDDLAGIRWAFDINGGQTVAIDVWKTHTSGLHFGVENWYYGSGDNLEANKMTGRVVNGDWDRDGYDDDIAVFYEPYVGKTEIHVWTSTGSGFSYQGIGWQSTGYTASKITDRIVAGDFDHDGRYDDIAVFYDYGGGQTRIHMFSASGSSNFSYGGSTGWWSTFGYHAGQITGRVVSGDFDRDGVWNDIAAFYDYGNGQTRIHVWRGNGSSFSYAGGNGWWSTYGYTASKITGRVVAGDFDRDGHADDIAAFYDYGSNQTRMHVWESKTNFWGTLQEEFDYQGGYGWWNVSGYNANMLTGKIGAGNVDEDNRFNDIIGLYDYGSSTNRVHVWECNNGSVSYQHWFACTKSAAAGVAEVAAKSLDAEEVFAIDAYPNPSTGQFNVTVSGSESFTLTVTDLQGRIVFDSTIENQQNVVLDLNDEANGIYVLKVVSNNNVITEKLIKH